MTSSGHFRTTPHRGETRQIVHDADVDKHPYHNNVSLVFHAMSCLAVKYSFKKGQIFAENRSKMTKNSNRGISLTRIFFEI